MSHGEHGQSRAAVEAEAALVFRLSGALTYCDPIILVIDLREAIKMIMELQSNDEFILR